jgi:hypothetical protein
VQVEKRGLNGFAIAKTRIKTDFLPNYFKKSVFIRVFTFVNPYHPRPFRKELDGIMLLK